MTTSFDVTLAEVTDVVQDRLDSEAEQGSNAALQGAVNAESALGGGASLLSSDTAYALRTAITAQRQQIADAERVAHAVVKGHPVDAAQYLSMLEARVQERAAQYDQARQAAIGELLAASAPPIDPHVPSGQSAAAAGLLRDALRMGVKPEALVAEAVRRNDDLSLHFLLDGSLWPLYLAKDTNLHQLQASAAEQRWAAAQDFPGSDLLGFLCGDGATLGAQARDAAVARFNSVKRAQTKARRAQNGR